MKWLKASGSAWLSSFILVMGLYAFNSNDFVRSASKFSFSRMAPSREYNGFALNPYVNTHGSVRALEPEPVVYHRPDGSVLSPTPFTQQATHLYANQMIFAKPMTSNKYMDPYTYAPFDGGSAGELNPHRCEYLPIGYCVAEPKIKGKIVLKNTFFADTGSRCCTAVHQALQNITEFKPRTRHESAKAIGTTKCGAKMEIICGEFCTERTQYQRDLIKKHTSNAKKNGVGASDAENLIRPAQDKLKIVWQRILERNGKNG